VLPGDPLRIPATVWNAALDLARPTRDETPDETRSPWQHTLPAGYDALFVNNGPEDVVRVGDQVFWSKPFMNDGQLRGLLPMPAEGYDAPFATRQPIILAGSRGPTCPYEPGLTQLSDCQNFAVALEDIPIGGVGLVRLMGYAWARVIIFHDAHRFADAQPLKTPELLSPCFELWRQSEVWELKAGESAPDCEPLFGLPSDGSAGDMLEERGPLRSSPVGQAEILWKEPQGQWGSSSLPGALGVAWCVVRISNLPLVSSWEFEPPEPPDECETWYRATPCNPCPGTPEEIFVCTSEECSAQGDTVSAWGHCWEVDTDTEFAIDDGDMPPGTTALPEGAILLPAEDPACAGDCGAPECDPQCDGYILLDDPCECGSATSDPFISLGDLLEQLQTCSGTVGGASCIHAEGFGNVCYKIPDDPEVVPSASGDQLFVQCGTCCKCCLQCDDTLGNPGGAPEFGGLYDVGTITYFAGCDSVPDIDEQPVPKDCCCNKEHTVVQASTVEMFKAGVNGNEKCVTGCCGAWTGLETQEMFYDPQAGGQKSGVVKLCSIISCETTTDEDTLDLNPGLNPCQIVNASIQTFDNGDAGEYTLTRTCNTMVWEGRVKCSCSDNAIEVNPYLVEWIDIYVWTNICAGGCCDGCGNVNSFVELNPIGVAGIGVGNLI